MSELPVTSSQHDSLSMERAKVLVHEWEEAHDLVEHTDMALESLVRRVAEALDRESERPIVPWLRSSHQRWCYQAIADGGISRDEENPKSVYSIAADRIESLTAENATLRGERDLHFEKRELAERDANEAWRRAAESKMALVAAEARTTAAEQRVRELEEAVRGGLKALNYATQLGMAEAQGHERTAAKLDKAIEEWRATARALLSPQASTTEAGDAM